MILECEPGYFNESDFGGFSKMVLRLFTLLICSALILNADDIRAQWMQMGGPNLSEVRAFVVKGDSLFAATNSGFLSPTGIFVSVDNGATWKSADSGLTNFRVNSLVLCGGSLFAATENGVFRSSDNGASWRVSDSGLTAHYVLTLIANGNDLFAGTTSGAFHSSDLGISWDAVRAGMVDTVIISLAASGTTVFAGTLDGYIYCSTNMGVNWITSLGHPFSAVASLQVIGDNVFAGGVDGVYRSTDDGLNWFAVNTGFENTSVGILATDGKRLYASTGNSGLYCSTDNGVNWADINFGLPNGITSVRALLASDTTLFVGMSSRGVFRSTISGASWLALNCGLPYFGVQQLAEIGSDLFAASTYDGIFHSTDYGATWSNVFPTTGMLRVHSLASIGSTLFAGTEIGVFVSTDYGESWTNRDTVSGPDLVVILDAINEELFAGTSGGGVFLSTDFGQHWTEVNTGLTNLVVSRLFHDGPNLFAWTTSIDTSLFISTNSGTSWNEVNLAGLTCKRVNSFAVSDETLFAVTDGGGVFVSNDSGNNWTVSNNGLVGLFSVGVASNGPSVFVSTQGGGIFRSTDKGGEWVGINERLNFKNMGFLFSGKDFLYAWTYGDGMWRRPLSEVTTSVRSSSLGPLEQNALAFTILPNPAYDKLTVKYMKGSINAKLELYNATGQRLINAHGNGTGEQTLDISSLPSGMYFLSLCDGAQVATQTVLISK